jgi:transposase-like protein
MTMRRRQHSGELNAPVVLEALRGERPRHEIAADYGVHPLQLPQWQKVALEGWPTRLSSRRGPKPKEEEALQAALYQQLGQWTGALDWLPTQVGPVC